MKPLIYLFAGIFVVGPVVSGVVALFVGFFIAAHADVDEPLERMGRVDPPPPPPELVEACARFLHERQVYSDRHICEQLERENGLV